MKTEASISSRRRHKRTRIAVVAAVAGTIAASLAGCSSGSGTHAGTAAGSAAYVTLTPAQQKHIRVYTVAPSTFHKSVDTTGVVDFDNDQATSVIAPFGGPVTRLLVDLGDHVKKGQPLAIVESPDFATAISAYRKAIATARTARRIADRDRDLLAHHGVSQREAEQARTDAAGAEADRDAALQALRALNIPPKTIDDIRAGRPVARISGVIRAPIAGTIVERMITPGQLLQAGATSCFTIADLSRMWVMARIFGSDIHSVTVKDPARIITGIGSRPLSGTVTNLSASVDPESRSVSARVVVDNHAGVLRKQMYVRVLISSKSASNGLLVPVSAILRDEENLPFLYIARHNGEYARRHVTLGYRDGDRYDISKGLHAGDRVVVNGALFVQFMQNQ